MSSSDCLFGLLGSWTRFRGWDLEKKKIQRSSELGGLWTLNLLVFKDVWILCIRCDHWIDQLHARFTPCFYLSNNEENILIFIWAILKRIFSFLSEKYWSKYTRFYLSNIEANILVFIWAILKQIFSFLSEQ